MLQTPPITALAAKEPQDQSLMSLSLVAFIAAIGLFITSLFLPVFITQIHDIHGYWVLAMGWLGFINFQFAWYAAPFAVLSIYISQKSPQLGLFLSIVAIIMASEAFLFTDIPFGKGDKVLDYGIGFYLWYLCFYLISFSILLRLVAWGSIEEEMPLISTSGSTGNPMSKEMTSVKESQEKVFFATKAKRRIEPRYESIVTPKRNAEDYGSSFGSFKVPPQLPKKNIYKRKVKNDVGAVGASPPPLPKLKVQHKRFALPPPLPKKRQYNTPTMDKNTATELPPPLPIFSSL